MQHNEDSHNKHIKKCEDCHKFILDIVDKKVNKKFNDIILNSKLQQLKNLENKNYTNKNLSTYCWKDTLIIVIGAIILIVIILLIYKTLKK